MKVRKWSSGAKSVEEFVPVPPLYVLELEPIMISGDEHVAPELFPRTFSCGHHLYLNVNKIAF